MKQPNHRLSPQDMQAAVALLAAGEVVAFATETVYGLGADATNPQAVRKVFAIKGRPSINPLIAHVSDVAMARRYARRWPAAAEALAAAFWPGPLTVVVEAADRIAPEVTAGGATVGLRCPDHPIALELIRRLDRPVAAPSANRSLRISPTTAQHVRDDLGDSVALILDGGPCRVGIESTVVDVSRDKPMILRLGAISQAMIEEVIGPVDRFTGAADGNAAAQSPGQQAVHYAPRRPAFRVEHGDIAAFRAAKWMDIAKSLHLPPPPEPPPREGGAAVVILTWPPPANPARARAMVMPSEPAAYAQALYGSLRAADAPPTVAIVIEMPPDEPSWAAVRDRLIRATRKWQ